MYVNTILYYIHHMITMGLNIMLHKTFINNRHELLVQVI